MFLNFAGSEYIFFRWELKAEKGRRRERLRHRLAVPVIVHGDFLPARRVAGAEPDKKKGGKRPEKKRACSALSGDDAKRCHGDAMHFVYFMRCVWCFRVHTLRKKSESVSCRVFFELARGSRHVARRHLLKPLFCFE